MNCPEIQDLLSPWLDGELSPDEREQVVEHLSGCQHCTQTLSRLQGLDASLRSQLAPQPEQLARLAERLAGALGATSTRAVTPSRTARFKGWPAVAAAALVLGVVLVPAFQWDGDWGANPGFKAITGNPQFEPLSIAQLVHVVGSVSIREPAAADWWTLPAGSPGALEFAAGTHVRTAAGGLCEVVTTCGNRLRLNESTEVALVSTTDVELVTGVVWCRAPSDCRVDMRPPPAAADALANSPEAKSPLPQFICPADTSCVTTSNEGSPWEILAADGMLEIVEAGATRPLNEGEVYRVDHSGLSSQSPVGNSLTAASWMLPLLALKPPGNAELEDWVARLVAQLGETKISYLSENQLRQLGPAGAEPLVRYVERGPAPEDHDRRRRAMMILRDVAPASMTGRMIVLLKDADPAVRVAAAQALRRLHQEDFGVTASQWEAGGPEIEAAIQKWREWESQRARSAVE